MAALFGWRFARALTNTHWTCKKRSIQVEFPQRTLGKLFGDETGLAAKAAIGNIFGSNAMSPARTDLRANMSTPIVSGTAINRLLTRSTTMVFAWRMACSIVSTT